MRRFACLALIATASLMPGSAHGQTDGLGIRALKRTPVPAAATVTAVFAISNQRPDTVQVMPHIDAPKDWTLLLGGTLFESRAGETGMLVLSFAVPSRAAAGSYPVRVWLTTRNDVRGTMDSVVVEVPTRRALDIVLADRPGYAVSGSTYEAGFVVRNRGNSPSRITLDVRSTLGSATLALSAANVSPDSAYDLGPEEARDMRVRVRTPEGLSSAADDVLEVTGHVVGDTLQTQASARVTVVPEPSRKIEEFLKIPTQVNLRAASASGVSPFEIYGRGRVIDGKAPVIDFLFRGPTGQFSSFGERDEYRVELSSKSWRARVGDHVFFLSPLTGSGQPGLGVGADATRGKFSLGAHSQQFRRQPEKGVESGGFVSVAPVEGVHVAVNGLVRRDSAASSSAATATSQLGSATMSLERGGLSAEGELARSTSGANSGGARSLRMSGRASAMSFDLGHLFADTGFSGSQRGAEHDYVTARSAFGAVSFGANASTHRSDLSRSVGVPYEDRFNIGGVSATAFNRVTMELGGASRTTTISAVSQTGSQRSVRARGDQPFVFGTVSLEGEVGSATLPGTPSTPNKTFSDVSLGFRRPMFNGNVALYGGRYSGGAITKGANQSVSLGGDLTQHIGDATDVTVMGYAIRQPSVFGAWHTQLDAQASYRLATGATLRLRARLISGGTLPAASQNVAYLEYGMPARLPVSRLRTVGRVYGRVVDAVNGNGVPNALVRLGPQVAITDKTGKVAFGGVPAGEHRLSMSQETSFADAVFVGDPTLNVDSLRTQPTTFTLAIARSARVDVDVRRFTVARTAVAGTGGTGVDSLVESGRVPNATLVLIGERDTLYRTTNDDGKAVFTDVPPGQWRIAIRGDAPAFHRFDPDRVDLTLAPGEAKRLTFRLVPRKREVQVIGDGQELRPQAADPKAQAGAGVKVIKPNDRQNQH